MDNCFEIILEGRVQGVGFRNYALTRAVINNIKGYVKNTYDGKLEIVCCGEKENLDKFISEIKKGPSFAYISKIKINEYTHSADFNDFRIKY